MVLHTTYVVLRVQYSCGVVLVFWFWREIVFGVTCILSVQYSCAVVSVFRLWREIILKTSRSGLRLFRHGQTDSQLNILLLLCSYICSTYYVPYVEYKYRSARKSDLMDTSNPPQADVDMNTATINVD